MRMRRKLGSQADSQNNPDDANTPSTTVEHNVYGVPLILLVALIVRLSLFNASYSGHADPPKYGDYEAQRHWMEVTINLPVSEWYRNTTKNNASHWGIDYPPLSAYQSWICGKAIQQFEPPAMELVASHGYETQSSKLLMRWTVVISDLLVLFPAALWSAHVFGGSSSGALFFTLASILLQPGLLLIDNGHFQYNGISLGMSAAAAAAIANNRHVLGSMLYCLALNHKQMSLYYAPAFFGHLLGRCLQKPHISGKVVAIAKLGITVVATFAVCWAPFLTSTDNALQVVQRIFPLRRGLYEDYVANFWCATSSVIKWRSLVAAPLMVRLSAAATLAAAAPAMVQQVLRPSASGLPLAMANSAMAFYMFAYQVHEKSILLVLVPLSLVASSMPYLATFAPMVACFSMFPLLERDGLTVQYIGALACFVGASLYLLHFLPSRSLPGTQTLWKNVFVGSIVTGAAAHLCRQAVAPPAHLPWLHDRLFITIAFVQLVVVALRLNVVQWTHSLS